MRTVTALIGALVLLPSHVPPPLVVHEWGTITTRHHPNGTPEGRLNRIAAADTLPAFVHRFEPPVTRTDAKTSLLKSPLTPGRPDVTMRLETPVIYFHPPAGRRSPVPLDVHVRFRGGVLNEFYPNADANVAVDVDRVGAKMAAGIVRDWNGATLDNYVVGDLRWSHLALRASVSLPATSSHVWRAPRSVRASSVLTPAGEGERYLFYRGVAHLDAVFQTTLTSSAVQLNAPVRLLWLRTESTTVPATWLVDVRTDGAIAFRAERSLTITSGAPGRELARIPLFSSHDYQAKNASDLRRAMKGALVAAGLFEDEAEAMLETWNASYFRAPGLRLLYLVPQEWIAYFLPLEISVSHQATRVLVGRIDLVETSAP